MGPPRVETTHRRDHSGLSSGVEDLILTQW